MIKLIKRLLQKCIKDIDAGNSNLTEDESIEVLDMLKKYTDKDKKLSKYQACKYLDVSRATFDRYVRCGDIPKGKKEAGFKELFWYEKDLKEYLLNHK